MAEAGVGGGDKELSLLHPGGSVASTARARAPGTHTCTHTHTTFYYGVRFTEEKTNVMATVRL